MKQFTSQNIAEILDRHYEESADVNPSYQGHTIELLGQSPQREMYCTFRLCQPRHSRWRNI